MYDGKKIAMLLCGELRTFDNKYVIKGFDKLRELYNMDIYVSVWKHRGRSDWSVKQNLNDNIIQNEIIDIDYIKKIFKTDNVFLYDYNEWLGSTIEKNFYKYRNINTVQYNATFGLSFLRQECIKKINKCYDVLVVTRPDSIFTLEPPSYFFNCEDKIWHQGTIPNSIYSTFFTSTSKNIIDICNWYDNDEVVNYTLSKMDKFEHCHIIFKYVEKMGISIGEYKGLYNNSLFCEPFRTEEYVKNEYLNLIKEHLLNGTNIGMDFDKKWFPFYE
jgi:hypothetical protein